MYIYIYGLGWESFRGSRASSCSPHVVFCYPLVTLMSHPRYPHVSPALPTFQCSPLLLKVTSVLPPCYPRATLMIAPCYPRVTPMLPSCYPSVTLYYPRVTRGLPSCYHMSPCCPRVILVLPYVTSVSLLHIWSHICGPYIWAICIEHTSGPYI